MSENKYEFKAEIKKLLDILSKSLYQHKEVFLRELISNSVDALKKVHFISLTDKDIQDFNEELKIEIITDSINNTITVRDTGIGMNKDELISNLGTIAGSGSQKFLEQLNQSQQIDSKKLDLDVIGQFGIGFYSIFMVAGKVNVISRSYKKEEEAYQWESDGTGEFTITKNDKQKRGTDVILYINDEDKEYLDKFKVESIIKKYSNYVSFPIYVSEIKKEEKKEEKKEKKKEEKKEEKKEKKKEEKKEEKKDEKEAEEEIEPKPVNELNPLWKRDKNEIKDDDYKNFYHFISNRYDEYTHMINYKVDGSVQFHTILFIPESDPLTFLRPDDEYGLSLYSKSVMIMKNCSELIPKWMRFIKGVVNSDDIPLNISRETIQTNRVMMKIEKLLIKRILREFEEIGEKDLDKFKKIWSNFGIYFKEGMISDPFRADKLLNYLRFKTSKTTDDEYRSLEDYIKDFQEDQNEIYYLVGENISTMRQSPHLGYYKENNLEVILFDEPIDNFLMMNIHEYKKSVGEGDSAEIITHKFSPVDVTEPVKDKEKDKEDEKEKKEKSDIKIPENIKKFLEHVKSILGEKILDTKISDRLYDNPCRLANPTGGMTSSMQRAMRYWTKTESGKEFQAPRKILEFNQDHPLINGLIELFTSNPEDSKIKPVINQLFENCLLAEGDLPNPSLMVPRINQLIEMLITDKIEFSESKDNSDDTKKEIKES